MLLASIPTTKIRSNRCLKLRLINKASVSLGVEVRHPAHRVAAWLFSRVKHFVIAHPFNHVQTNIADVVGANNLLAARFEDIANRSA